MGKYKLITLLFFILFNIIVYGECYRDPSTQNCPTSGSTLLDDTYPNQAFVISNTPSNDKAISSKSAQALPTQFILKVLESYNYSKDAPKILFAANADDFTKLKEKLNQMIKDSNGSIPESILDSVVSVPGASEETWQQDYFESFIDPKTGNPVLRDFSYFFNTGKTNEVGSLAKNLCEGSLGPTLKSDAAERLSSRSVEDRTRSFLQGEMGGNIEGLPGGLCLIGDNQSKKFAKQYCDKEENIVQIEASWSQIAHVDEIVKVVPNNIPGIPKECSFSLMFASPKKAMELLSEPRNANLHFLDDPSLSSSSSKEEVDKSKKNHSMGLCEIIEDHILPTRKDKLPNKTQEPTPVKTVFREFKKIFLNLAFAQQNSVDKCPIETVTNWEFKEAYEKSELKTYNELVQKEMDEAKMLISEKILSRLPQCRPYLKMIDVPNLFDGTLAKNTDDSNELPSPGNGRSLFPNPTNGVVSNKTMIFSDPQNEVFRQYLKDEMKKINMKSNFIDTWDYAHKGGGNLHCISHSIPYCNPVSETVK